MTAEVAPAAGEGTHHVPESSVGAVPAHERAHAAERQIAESAVEVDAGVAAEEAAALTQSPRIGAEAVFKHEADLEAVAEVFGALEADAGTDVLAREHLEARFGRAVDGVVLLPRHAVVEYAVDLHVGGEGAGRRKKAAEREGEQSAFHRDSRGNPRLQSREESRLRYYV